MSYSTSTEQCCSVECDSTQFTLHSVSAKYILYMYVPNSYTVYATVLQNVSTISTVM